MRERLLLKKNRITQNSITCHHPLFRLQFSSFLLFTLIFSRVPPPNSLRVITVLTGSILAFGLDGLDARTTIRELFLITFSEPQPGLPRRMFMVAQINQKRLREMVSGCARKDEGNWAVFLVAKCLKFSSWSD